MIRNFFASLGLLLLVTPALIAAEKDVDLGNPIVAWPPLTLTGALLASTAFGVLGIVLAVLGFKLFDWLTPGDLQKEVFENKNMAAAILGAAVILGICLILAAAVH